MLVLTRKIGETVIINDNISVTVLGIQGGIMKLGFNAPRDVSIDREEIFYKKQEDRQRDGNF